MIFNEPAIKTLKDFVILLKNTQIWNIFTNLRIKEIKKLAVLNIPQLIKAYKIEERHRVKYQNFTTLCRNGTITNTLLIRRVDMRFEKTKEKCYDRIYLCEAALLKTMQEKMLRIK